MTMGKKNGIFVYTEHGEKTAMRTNIDIDDRLMKMAMESSGLTSKKGVVELALRELISMNRRRRLADVRGRLKWSGDLDEMRIGR